MSLDVLATLTFFVTALSAVYAFARSLRREAAFDVFAQVRDLGARAAVIAMHLVSFVVAVALLRFVDFVTDRVLPAGEFRGVFELISTVTEWMLIAVFGLTLVFQAIRVLWPDSAAADRNNGDA
jgi:hypothetical protein